VTGYAVVIEGEEGSYSAWSQDLPGCVATGGSLDEVEQRMREANEFRLPMALSRPGGPGRR
jgi:predicted RNase H-like HicB family nuclease